MSALTSASRSAFSRVFTQQTLRCISVQNSSATFRISSVNKCTWCTTCIFGSCHCSSFSRTTLERRAFSTTDADEYDSWASQRTAAPKDSGLRVPSAVSGVKTDGKSLLKESKKIEFEDKRRKEISWRAKQRGWLEVDWIMGNFASEGDERRSMLNKEYAIYVWYSGDSIRVKKLEKKSAKISPPANHLANLDEDQLVHFEAILDEENIDLFRFLTGEEEFIGR
jgi:succinate dehydrogenase flavin-adding protein (antitoxin of CptAB toxin-antitoxin module)